MPANEDVVQKVTGNFGPWQLRSIILIFLCKIPATWFMACISYTAPLPKADEYHCKSTAKMLDKCYIYQKFEQRSKNYSAAFAISNIPSQSIQQIVPCDHFEHNAEYVSLVTQFDLVCSREILVSVTQVCHALGGLIGGLTALHILKYVSPKGLMLCGMIGQIVSGNLTGLASTYILHVYFRWLTAVFCAFMTTSGQIIISDITHGKPRTLAVTLSEVFSAIGLILLPGLSIFFESWSSLYVAMSSSLLFLIYPHRWISDSPRWLLKHNKINQALKVLLESAAFNNREIPVDLEQRLQKISKDLQNIPNPSYWSIWDGKTPKHFIILLHWSRSVSVVIYTVMILMIRFIGVDRMYVTTFSMGVSEILGISLGLCLIMYCRRRWLLSGYLMILAGLATYFLWLIPDTIQQSRQNAYELAFWLILKLVTSSSLVLLTACSGDLVSAEKRHMLTISTGTFSRFWLTLIPFSLTLLKIHRLIPITIFATVVISSGWVMWYFNRHFGNTDKPKIYKTRATILSRQCSPVYLDINPMDEHYSSSDSGCDNPAISMSMEELWKCEEN